MRKKELTSLAPSGFRWTSLAPNVTERDGMLLLGNICIFEWYFLEQKSFIGILRNDNILMVFSGNNDLSML